jgi:hypothetical protein
MRKHKGFRFWTGALALTAAMALAGNGLEAQANGKANGTWLAGDFHQHTYYTDGITPFDFVMAKNVEFGLDWWANSEHGGCCRWYDGNAVPWDSYATILGDYRESSGHQVMWRWQSLRDYVFPGILDWRALVPEKRIASGVEWNVPDHEHCSVGIIADDAEAISAFEYMFDRGDYDTSRNGEKSKYGIRGRLGKYNETHDDAVMACAWMQEQLDRGRIDDGWIVFAHPERQGPYELGRGGFNVEHFRDFNNAGPDACFGFEGAPGHQPSGGRGGFGDRAFGGTFGGTGFYTAEVGGLWDALLGEGRHWFNFASSDYHGHVVDHGRGDFYPGEYQKNYSFVMDSDGDGDYSLTEIAQSLRSGRSFHVMGDLVDMLEFEANYKNRVVPMGNELNLPARIRDPLTVEIRFSSPPMNHNGDVPVVDHIDVIAGDIYGMIPPESPLYSVPENTTARVEWTLELADFAVENGEYVATLTIEDPESMLVDNDALGFYLRLRGTNMDQGTEFETDEFGNPLADILTDALGYGPAEEAWADLWFYSNPIFIYLK